MSKSAIKVRLVGWLEFDPADLATVTNAAQKAGDLRQLFIDMGGEIGEFDARTVTRKEKAETASPTPNPEPNEAPPPEEKAAPVDPADHLNEPSPSINYDDVNGVWTNSVDGRDYGSAAEAIAGINLKLGTNFTEADFNNNASAA